MRMFKFWKTTIGLMSQKRNS